MNENMNVPNDASPSLIFLPSLIYLPIFLPIKNKLNISIKIKGWHFVYKIKLNLLQKSSEFCIKIH